MSKIKAFKIITHLSQALVLEEEIFNAQDDQYKIKFAEDFCDEQLFLREMQMFKQESDPSSQKQKVHSLDESILKKMHRKLAMKTHPDASGGDDSEFKKIQKAYENHDSAALLVSALDHDIDIEIEEESIKQIMEDIHQRRLVLKEREHTLRWIWGTAIDHEDARKKIRSAMQIEETVFKTWLKKRDD